MTDQPFWNPKTELMPRTDLRELQLAKLRHVVAWARARPLPAHRSRASTRPAPHLGRHRPHPVPDPGVDGLAGHAPAVRRAPGHRCGERDPAAHHVRHLAGPAACADSRKDWSGRRRCGATRCGPRASGRATSATSRSATARSSGSGACTTRWRRSARDHPRRGADHHPAVRQIHDWATVVASTPTYALRLAGEAEEIGIDLVNGPVRIADPLRRAGRVHPGDQGADRTEVGRGRSTRPA
ncbi:hypothetical protein HBB16_10315 [Pseudonocardia sp. MCCB 268]|nr:hypothetical protein [Pseudonocardia cytotoxica]